MVAGQGGGGGREGGRESERVTRGRGACECACGQVAVRVRVRVHMQESARTRTCCRRCVRVFVLCKCACLCGGKACGHVHARAEQRQVLIPHGVSRDTMRRVVVWASGRGWAEDVMARATRTPRPCGDLSCEIRGPQNTVPKTKIAFGSSLWLRFALRCVP